MTNKFLLLIVMAICLSLPAMGAATIVINNVNAAGVGFNDPTPATPVGGNTGTTVGEQRLNAFNYAASLWGAKVDSNVTVVINAQFTALACTATAATLGSAGTTSIHANFPGAVRADTWYNQALANKLANFDLADTLADINANFNSNLGQTNCLTGTFFYLGFDNNHGNNIDLVTVVLHEFAHGLGFQSFTNGTTGSFLGTPALPAIWDHFLLDNSLGLTWVNMTAAERAASAIAVDRLVWNGPNVSASVPSVLLPPPAATVTAPAGVAGIYVPVGTAAFGPRLTIAGVTEEVMPVVDQADGTGLACDALSPANAAAVNGKIALVDRGTCGFTIKVKNAQNAGAIGVIVANNAAGVIAMGGADPTITIPSLMVSQEQGDRLKAALASRSRLRSGMVAKLGLEMQLGLSGADSSSRIRMFTPNPFQGGSSVSHFDTTAFPNVLMEPAINGDLTHSVDVPEDLTFKLLKDIGW